MLSRSALRAATQSARHPGATRVAGLTATGKALAQTQAPCSSTLGRRYISMYGYTQAKALIYSKYGEPKDVLRLVSLQSSPSPSLYILAQRNSNQN
jgi:trans-2-enoyl-CoA reductase